LVSSNKSGSDRRRRVSAEQLASRQRDISVSEFFVKNRHLLGFDSPARALLTTVKEAVDNAIDACEEAGILPAVIVEIEPRGEGRYRVAVEDNGPGVTDERAGKIFAKLLYGSKFHAPSQSRGQQGLGIAAAGMYGQLTTGEPTRVLTRTARRRSARELIVSIDTKRNRPQIHKRRNVDWNVKHGTRVEIVLEGQYQRGQHSVDEYLRLTALANPHVRIEFEDPDAQRVVHERVVRRLPRAPVEVPPHPHGVELGLLATMLRETTRRTLASFLSHEFSRVGATSAKAILEQAGRKLGPRTHPHELDRDDTLALHRALSRAEVSAPDRPSVVPLGEKVLLRGLRRDVEAAFYTATTRAPAVYRGNPFVVEVALAYGRPRSDGSGDEASGHGTLGTADSAIDLLRFANRVPLLFAAGGCAITKAVGEVNWRGYGLSQPGGGLPLGPMILVVHLASVWVPFTSESKEAIANYPEIIAEIRLALQHCGRELGVHVERERRRRRELVKRREIERYLPHLGLALQEILTLSDRRRDRVLAKLEDTLTEDSEPAGEHG
jgi:DNA topoisomerase-6 subunit B